jgi:hypothetical protein
MTTPPTRESWLEHAQEELSRYLTAQGYPYPNPARVSVGFPGGRGGVKAHTIGQCWNGKQATDGRGQIFISPVLEDPITVLSTLLHEMVHHAVGTLAGHKGPFKRCALAVGLKGPMTATTPSDHLIAALQTLLTHLEPYPHAGLRVGGGKKKPGSRLLKISCPSCEWVGRTTQKGVDIGLPTCVCGELLQLTEKGEPDDE